MMQTFVVDTSRPASLSEIFSVKETYVELIVNEPSNTLVLFWKVCDEYRKCMWHLSANNFLALRPSQSAETNYICLSWS